MGNTEQILVVILSVAFALFLILGIVVMIKLMDLIDHMKHIAEKAEKLADKAESVGEFLKFTAKPAAILKIMSNIAGIIFKHKNKRGK